MQINPEFTVTNVNPNVIHNHKVYYSKISNLSDRNE